MTTPASNEPTIASRPIFQGRIIDVRVDTVQLPNGREGAREIVTHAPSICVAPVDADRNALLVRQYRKPAEASLLKPRPAALNPAKPRKPPPSANYKRKSDTPPAASPR